MSFAGVPNGRVMGLAGLCFFCWSVVATAQTAPAAGASKAPSPAPEQAKQPATSKPPEAKAPPAGAKAAPTDSAGTKSAPGVNPSAPAASKPAATTAPGTPTAPAAAEPATSASSGESWVPSPQGQTAPNTAATPWTDSGPSQGSAPPPVYYVEQTPNPTTPPPAPPAAPPPAASVENADPMRLQIEEPPPPPVPRHMAPKTAFWIGARVGYFVPFGDLWGRCSSTGYSYCDRLEGTKWSDVAATGPMFELDVGARIGRNYVLYLGWERAQLGGADGTSPNATIADRQSRAESDFVAVGVRLSADPDDVGLLLDLAIGARRFRGIYANDVELQLTDAPLESRLGLGVDIRTSRYFSLSPMLTLGLGSFGKAEWVTADSVQSALPTDSDRLTHGWLTLQLGGHFDLATGN